MRALAALFFGATCVSFAAVFVKLIEPLGMGPTAIAFWRTALGAMILFMCAIVTRQRLFVPWRLMRWTVAAGFLFFIDLYCWHKSVIWCGAGMSTILAATQVLVVAVLSWLVFKERLKLRFIVSAVAAVGGVGLLIGIGSEVEFSTEYYWGVIFGLLTGLAYAHYLIVVKLAGHVREIAARESSSRYNISYIVMMAWTSLSSAFFLAIAVFVDPAESIVPPSTRAFLYAGGLALVAQALGWWVISRSLPRVAASRGSLALLFQPVLTTVWGFLFFGERLVLLQIVGAAITLTAIYIGSISREKSAMLPIEKG